MSLMTVFLIAFTLDRWRVEHTPGAHTLCLAYQQEVMDVVRTCVRHHERLTNHTFHIEVPRGARVWAEVMYEEKTALSNTLVKVR